ncbi:hypothetical protein WSS_A13689 [Rhodococcus opacus M213]|uniref:Uncharacterized protein n=1 Tax=Rhodococcus opacus M213 TaxID=1129896 RepID=K8XL70_RHOOP|nr:hypothetical protein [Rhodococcus opacus]EKT82154.1 hypothetical protein WSS_A13689 [Rhodococcus opacus M213]
MCVSFGDEYGVGSRSIWRVSHIGGAALAQFLARVAHDASVLGETAQSSRADDELKAVFVTGSGEERRVPWRWWPEVVDELEPPETSFCRFSADLAGIHTCGEDPHPKWRK